VGSFDTDAVYMTRAIGTRRAILEVAVRARTLPLDGPAGGCSWSFGTRRD